jgi:hypothetical protein
MIAGTAAPEPPASQRVEVTIHWQALGEVAAAGDHITLPKPPPGLSGGLYRFVMRRGEHHRVYVGETENYARRFYQYANPGPSQTTNQRMKARLVRLLPLPDTSARVDVAVNVEIRLGDTAVDANHLPQPFYRRLIENAALVDLAAQGGHLANGVGYPPGELDDAQVEGEA